MSVSTVTDRLKTFNRGLKYYIILFIYIYIIFFELLVIIPVLVSAVAVDMTMSGPLLSSCLATIVFFITTIGRLLSQPLYWFVNGNLDRGWFLVSSLDWYRTCWWCCCGCNNGIVTSAWLLLDVSSTVYSAGCRRWDDLVDGDGCSWPIDGCTASWFWYGTVILPIPWPSSIGSPLPLQLIP